MIKIELTVEQAAAVMHLLLEEHKLYGFNHAPARIERVREAIQIIDEGLTEEALSNKEDVIVPLGEVNAE